MAKHVGNATDDISPEIHSFMKEFPSLEYDQEKKKIRCQLSGHELPCQLIALQSYTGGRKYKNFKARDDANFKKYEPHIKQSFKKSHEHQLFCRLTLKHLNRNPMHVERHVNGRRYTKALERWDECQRLGIKYIPASKQSNAAPPVDVESDGDHEEKQFFSNPDAITKGTTTQDSDAESDDSFSDLYPAVDFDANAEAGGTENDNEKQLDDFEDEEGEEEKMEVEEDMSAGGDIKPKRSKHKGNHGSHKGHTPNKKFKKDNSQTTSKQTQPQSNKGNHQKAGKKSKGKKKKKAVTK